MGRRRKNPKGTQRRGDRYRAKRMTDGKVEYGAWTGDPAVAAAEYHAMAGQDSRGRPCRIYTLQDAVGLVLTAVDGKRREATVAYYESQFAVILAEWAPTTPLSAIGPDDIERFIRRRMAEKRQIRDKKTRKVIREERKVRPATLAKHRTALSRLFRLAIRKGWLQRNPLEQTEWPTVERRKIDWFTWDELFGTDGIVPRIAVVSREDADVVELLARTGMRRMEAARLTVDLIDFRSMTIDVEGKVVDSDPVLFEESSIPVLQRLIDRAEDGKLFPGGPQGITVVLRNWARRLKVPKLRAHSLRHSFATHLLRSGIPIRDVQRFLRHKSLRMTELYLHLTDSDLRAGLRAALQPRTPRRGSETA